MSGAGGSRAAAWLAAAAVGLAAAFAAWGFIQRRNLENELAALEVADRRVEATRARVQGDLDRERQADAAAAAAAAKHAAAVTAAKEARLAKRPDVGELVYSHPKLLALYVRGLKLYLNQMYGSVFAQLRLSKDQIDRIEGLIIQNMEDHLDLNSTAQKLGLANDDPALADQRRQIDDQLKTGEQGVLGSAYPAFSAASRMQAVRGSVNQLEYMTLYSGAPLTSDESTRLVQVLANSSGAYVAGKDASVGTVNWDTAVSQASSFLAPSQMTALRGVAALNQFQALLNQFNGKSPQSGDGGGQ